MHIYHQNKFNKTNLTTKCDTDFLYNVEDLDVDNIK